jgi:hypothetical protein
MSDDKPYKCTYLECSSFFKTKSKLTRHMAYHLEERPFVCTYEKCSLSFKTKDDLNQHMNRHSKERPFVCTFSKCYWSFKTKPELEHHIVRHSDKRPFICTFLKCSSSFKTKSDLDQHMVRHSEETLFSCTFPKCSSSFKTKPELEQHMICHSEKRPFVCTFLKCSSSFKTKHTLNSHMFSHIEETPFVCTFPKCSSSFKTKHYLSRHQKCIHSEEGKQRQKKSETTTYNSLIKCNLDLKREHQINVSCNGGNFYRIDYVHISNGIMFFIENDEHQHDHYPVSCEIRRMINTKSVLIQEGNNMPLVFIRYNPDAYHVDNQVRKIKKEDRIKRLVQLIQTISQHPINCPPLSIYYLFYNMKNNEPIIFQDSEYIQDVKSLVKYIYE